MKRTRVQKYATRRVQSKFVRELLWVGLQGFSGTLCCRCEWRNLVVHSEHYVGYKTVQDLVVFCDSTTTLSVRGLGLVKVIPTNAWLSPIIRQLSTFPRVFHSFHINIKAKCVALRFYALFGLLLI